MRSDRLLSILISAAIAFFFFTSVDDDLFADTNVERFPAGEGDAPTNTPPFDLGELGNAREIDPEKFPSGNKFLEDILGGQFEFPNAEEGGSYFLTSEGELASFRGINIEGSIEDPNLTDYERTIGENLISEGNQLIGVDDGNVRKSLGIPKGTQAADYLSATPSGRFNLTEVKGSEPGSAGAEVGTAIRQLKSTYEALIEKVPGAKLGKVEVAIPEGATLKDNYEVSGNQIVRVTAEGTEVVKVGGKVVTIRR